jgi:C-3',4' desaturase CrtD
MPYEIIIVGAGIGGLTAGALLAARGFSVCVLERAERPGGCAAVFEKFGYAFELGASLYACWGKGEIHDRVFVELPVDPPETRDSAPAYVVRLPGQCDVAIDADPEKFEANLRMAFPECADRAVDFYNQIDHISEGLIRILTRLPDAHTASRLRLIRAAAPDARVAAQLLRLLKHPCARHLSGTSERFRRFIDIQLQTFGQRPSDSCAYLYAAMALAIPRRGMASIRGGASALPERLAESIKKSGGEVRLNAPVLRLVYDSYGHARGVNLLNGETVEASRAVISNLTIWDTYGRLVGLDHTPERVRSEMKKMWGWGAYLLFLGLEDKGVMVLPGEHILTLTDWQSGKAYEAETAQFTFTCAPSWDPRAPEGKRAVTVWTHTPVEQWFTFHKDETEHEEMDQAILERWWKTLHTNMPELGDGIEVIETATPRTLYEMTRRKLGMVGGVGQSVDLFGMRSPSYRTPIPNLYLVGDTTFPGQGIAAVSHSAMVVANEITRHGR